VPPAAVGNSTLSPRVTRSGFRCVTALPASAGREARSALRRTDSGDHIMFHFCPACGSTVFYEPDQEPDLIAIPVGAFADPSFPTPTVSVYESRRHAWTGLPPEIEHFD